MEAPPGGSGTSSSSFLPSGLQLSSLQKMMVFGEEDISVSVQL